MDIAHVVNMVAKVFVFVCFIAAIVMLAGARSSPKGSTQRIEAMLNAISVLLVAIFTRLVAW